VRSKRPGVTVNRRDLITVPLPDANLLWRNLHVRESTKDKGTQNIRIDIIVSGVSSGAEWQCGLRFDYANEESFYCRPLRRSEDKHPERMPVPEEAQGVRVAYLPPMWGLTATETRLNVGAINVRLGEGRTAEVLRNPCHQILEGENGKQRWKSLAERVRHFFGVELEEPRYWRDHAGLQGQGHPTGYLVIRSRTATDAAVVGPHDGEPEVGAADG
jgi:hypothetical protein